jgi:hypothetical protein
MNVNTQILGKKTGERKTARKVEGEDASGRLDVPDSACSKMGMDQYLLIPFLGGYSHP